MIERDKNEHVNSDNWKDEVKRRKKTKTERIFKTARFGFFHTYMTSSAINDVLEGHNNKIQTMLNNET